MSDCSYEDLRSRISGLCNLAGMNLDDFNKNSQIESEYLKVYTSEMISNFKESMVVCSGSSILRNRIVLSIDLVREILSNTPSKWANELPAVEYWKDLVENVFSDIISHRSENNGLENLPDYNSDSLRNLILKIQREISKETWNL